MLLFEKASLPGVGDSVPMQLLEGRDMVGLTIGGPLGELFNRELRRLDVSVREVVSNQSFYIAAALTRCGAGMAVVDEFTARASRDGTTGFRPFSPSLRFKVQPSPRTAPRRKRRNSSSRCSPGCARRALG